MPGAAEEARYSCRSRAVRSSTVSSSAVRSSAVRSSAVRSSAVSSSAASSSAVSSSAVLSSAVSSSAASSVVQPRGPTQQRSRGAWRHPKMWVGSRRGAQCRHVDNGRVFTRAVPVNRCVATPHVGCAAKYVADIAYIYCGGVAVDMGAYL